MNESVFAQNQAIIRVITSMYEKGVVKVDAREGFLLASGKRSPVYLDHRKLFGEPGLREAALDLWCDVLCERLPELAHASAAQRQNYAVAGTATAGIAPGFGLACRLGVPFAYVRSKPKDHGLAQRVEGADLSGRKILVVDDMVTTGGSLLQACQALRLEAVSAQVVLLSSFSSKLGGLLPDQKEQPFCSVVTLKTILKVGQESGLLQKSDLQKCLEWLG